MLGQDFSPFSILITTSLLRARKVSFWAFLLRRRSFRRSTSIFTTPRRSFLFPISEATKPTIFGGGVAKQLIRYLNSSQTFSCYQLTGAVVDISRCAKTDPSTDSHACCIRGLRSNDQFLSLFYFYLAIFFRSFVAIVLITIQLKNYLSCRLSTLSAVYISVNSLIKIIHDISVTYSIANSFLIKCLVPNYFPR